MATRRCPGSLTLVPDGGGGGAASENAASESEVIVAVRVFACTGRSRTHAQALRPKLRVSPSCAASRLPLRRAKHARQHSVSQPAPRPQQHEHAPGIRADSSPNLLFDRRATLRSGRKRRRQVLLPPPLQPPPPAPPASFCSRNCNAKANPGLCGTRVRLDVAVHA